MALIWPSSWKGHLLLRSLVPSFIADVIWSDHRPAWKLHPTSYLDGLRGIASMIVFLCHYTENNHRILTPSYGLNPDHSPSSWIQLPFLRIIFSGRPMVHIFFVISGFVLSYKPVKMIHARNLEKCYGVLASSAFRRPIRLLGPCVVSTFIIMLLIQSGHLYTPTPTFAEQFWNWKDDVFHRVTWPWGWDTDFRPAFDVHLWTIPIEFAHSMLLFLVILTLSRTRQLLRRCAVVGIMAYSLCSGKWAAFEFMAGLFLAECHAIQGAHGGGAKLWESSSTTDFLGSYMTLPGPKPRAWMGGLARGAMHAGIIVAALFVGGWPNEEAENTPGIRYLNALTPEPFATMDPLAPQKYWFALAACLAVWSCGELRPARRFLEGGFAQYCGRVSYAVYICHGPVLDSLQEYVIGTFGQPSVGDAEMPDFVPGRPPTGVRAFAGWQTPGQRTLAWFMGLVFLAPAVVWVADVFWRGVDNPMISLGRKVENMCLDSEHVEESRPVFSAAA